MYFMDPLQMLGEGPYLEYKLEVRGRCVGLATYVPDCPRSQYCKY